MPRRSHNACGQSFHMAIEPRPSCRNTASGAVGRCKPTQRYSIVRGPREAVAGSSANALAFMASMISLASGLRRILLAQAKALDLAGRGLGQIVDEQDVARILVRREPRLYE